MSRPLPGERRYAPVFALVAGVVAALLALLVVAGVCAAFHQAALALQALA